MRAGGRRLAPLVLAFAGLYLLLAALAWPALLHHVTGLQGHRAIVAIEEGRLLTDAGLQRALISRREALAALEHNRARRELAQVHLYRARDVAVDGAVRHDDVATAAGELRKALGRAPADHFAWYHLAMAEALGANAPGAARALAAAYGFGPYHPPIQAARAGLGIALWADLEDSSRERVLAELAEVRAGRRR